MAEQKRLADGRPRRQSGKAARCEHTKRWFILPILQLGAVVGTERRLELEACKGA